MADPLVMFVSSEMYPFSKSGGLGDVVGALPVALRRLGVNVSVFTPMYGRVATSDYPIRLVYENLPINYPWPGLTADIYGADYHGVQVFFVDRAEFFDRRFLYDTHKGPYYDNCERYIFFCRAAMEWAKLLEKPPTVMHAHDWHAALVPGFLHFWRADDPFWKDTYSMMTIHNLAFQGRFSYRLFENSGLPLKAWNLDGAEFYQSFNMLKTGIAYADLVSTVSPTYAEEILTPEFGCGLEGILKKRSDRLVGILNGADYEVWDPRADKFIAANYTADDLRGKWRCKTALFRELGLDRGLVSRPLLGFIGRFRRQKGIDLLLEIVPELMKKDVTLCFLGEGRADFEARVQELAETYPGRISAIVGYTEDYAHRIQAATDIFLMPSRYEPCGLTQMYSLRYGSIPVVSAVGGLNDTIIPYPHPHATGFIFPIPEIRPFADAVNQALEVFEQKPTWSKMKKRAMSQHFSWGKSARQYVDAYNFLCSGKFRTKP